jgi:uncharacterized OB-fold protein
MNTYDALETAYKNGFDAGYQSRDHGRGTWEFDEIVRPYGRTIDLIYCSECGCNVLIITPYCPYCGTRMNLED